jgi:hypothetical protein
MGTILRSGVHMLQVAAMVCLGFALLSLLESDLIKKSMKLISRRILERHQGEDTARSEV